MKLEWVEEAKAWKAPGAPQELARIPRGCLAWDNARKCWWIPELAWKSLERAADAEHGGLFLRYHVRGQAQRIEPAPTARPLLPHQVDAVSHLVGLGRAGLFDDMGSGKTASVLAAYETVKQAVPNVRLLVLCPKRVIGEWANEVRLTLGREIKPDHEWVVNYDRIWREDTNLGLHAYISKGPTILVLDECHVAAGITSKRFIALEGLAKRVANLWALSGTPVRNKPESFFPVYKLISGAAVTFDQFAALYCTTVRGRITGYKRLEELEAVTHQYCLRREVHEILTLPPMTEQSIPLKLEGPQRTAYNEAADALLAAVGSSDSEEGQNKVRALLNRLLMASAHPALVDDSATDDRCVKLGAIDEILAEAGDQKVLIWSRYPRVLERIAARCREHGRLAVTMHGANSDNVNADNKRAFLTDPQVKVCCLSLGAFAEGINLQVATIAIYHDLYWEWDKFHQSQRRLWRTGQTKPVHLYYLLASPIERYVFESLEAKEGYQKALVGRPKSFDPTNKSLLRVLGKPV